MSEKIKRAPLDSKKSTENPETTKLKQSLHTVVKKQWWLSNYPEARTFFEEKMLGFLLAAAILCDYQWDSITADELYEKLEEIAKKAGAPTTRKGNWNVLFSPLNKSLRKKGVKILGNEPKEVFIDTVTSLQNIPSYSPIETPRKPVKEIPYASVPVSASRSERGATWDPNKGFNSGYIGKDPYQ